MAKAARLAPEQLRALDRLKRVRGIEGFYLAGASAIAWHLGHRRSRDLDLFSVSADVNLESVQRAAQSVRGIGVVATGEVSLALEVEHVPVDLVRYPYPPLERLRAGPRGFLVAGLSDLAAMKLSAIARRGIKRDFWDLFELARAGLSLREAADAYVRRFKRSEADLYHVQRALTWFDDAEKDPVAPEGLTPAKWRSIRRFFLAESPKLLARPASP